MNRFVKASFLSGAILLASAGFLRAATYFRIPDRDLVDRAPVAVRATAVGSRVVPTGGLRTETRTAFTVSEVLRGSAENSIEVALPGGTLPSGAGSFAWMPTFRPGGDYVLFLYIRPDGVYGVVELELGIFAVQYDTSGKAFAVRPRFQAAAKQSLKSFAGDPGEHPRELRAFLAMISGEEPSTSNAPSFGLQPEPPAGGGVRPMWVSFDTTSANLFRWSNNAAASVGYVDEDTSDSPGPQAHVPGGGLTEIQNAIALWTDDSTSNIDYSFSGPGSTTVTIFTDDVSQFGGSGIPCSLGVVGLTSISFSGAHTFKNESYNTLTGASVYLRRWDCTSPSSYLATAFENVATHELGHSLGLGHPDQGTSPHDNTPNDVSGAVMISVQDFNRAVGLGSDDVEGICYLYGNCTGASPPPPPTTKFYTLTPCRILDTRNATGPYGGPSLAARSSRTFVLAGHCGVPVDAKAVSLNITVTQPTSGGALKLNPAGVTPTAATAISFAASQTIANNAIAFLGAGGGVSVEDDQTSGTTQFIIDVNGYFK